MSSIIGEAIGDKYGLPDDIFTYNHERFYEFIGQQYGVDLAELFRFQAIRNATHLLNTSCNDIMSILEFESNDIKVLKNLCCFQIAGDKYQMKLGVKLALNNLIELVNIKQQQQNKKKRSSIQPLSINRTQPQPQTQTSAGTSNETTVETQSELSLLPPIRSKSNTLFTQSRLPTLQKKLNKLDHIADIENRINKWWSSMDSSDLSLSEGSHYVLEINKSLNDTYACILTCKCHNRFKLPFVTPGLFKLSSFYRHVKEKQCIKLLKIKHGQENAVIIDDDSAASQSNSSNRSLNTVSKKKTSANVTSKRTLSPSTQTSSKTVTSMVKKKRILSTNNTDSSQE